MTQLSREGAAQIEINKMSLPENRFQIASQKIKKQNVTEKMPWAAVQQRGGHKLPRISIEDSVLAQGQIIRHEAGLENIEAKLADKRCDIQRDDRSECDALRLRPRSRKDRWFSPREPHVSKGIA